MPFSNNYRLEAVCDKKSNQYSALEILSLILKIVALVLLVIFFRYFYIAIAVWLVTIPLNMLKRNLIYKYLYVLRDGRLIIIKEYNAERQKIVHDIDIKTEIKNMEVAESENNKYYDYPSDFNITVETEECTFGLAVDRFFYGLMDYNRRMR